MSHPIVRHCLGKARWRNQDEAEHELARWKACGYPQAAGKVAYVCKFCSGSHVGSPRRKGGGR